MNILAIDDRSELSAHQSAIEALFTSCFGSRMSADIWRWAYLDNPHGEPYVTVCYDGEQMVGHYAMIPLPLTDGERAVSTYLSMTTMVAASHRQHGLFVKLATATYDRARQRGAAFVMGFPNTMSAPGFQRRLGWKLPVPDRVVTLSRDELLARRGDLQQPGSGKLWLDLRDERHRAWRLARPGATYEWRDGLAFKRYGDGIDVLWYERPDSLEQLPDARQVNLLVLAGTPGFDGLPSFDYQFGGTDLAVEFADASIVRQMALSDVF